MNARMLSAVVALGVVLGRIAAGDELAVQSFDTQGLLVWANTVTDGVYTVEWAPAVQGPWSRTWTGMTGLTGTNATLSARVPMFFRVAAATVAQAETQRPAHAGEAVADTSAKVVAPPEGTAERIPLPVPTLPAASESHIPFALTPKVWIDEQGNLCMLPAGDLKMGEFVDADMPTEAQVRSWYEQRLKAESRTSEGRRISSRFWVGKDGYLYVGAAGSPASPLPGGPAKNTAPEPAPVRPPTKTAGGSHPFDALSYDGTVESLRHMRDTCQTWASNGSVLALCVYRQALLGLGDDTGFDRAPTKPPGEDRNRMDAGALAAIERKAGEGDVFFQTVLGILYINHGSGERTDKQKGMKLLESASAAGYHDASYKLGLILFHAAQATPEEIDKGLTHYRLAVKQGSAMAAYNLACIYRDGYRVAADDQESARYLMFAAEHGHATACRDLGGYYVLGKGVVRNRTKALDWLLKAQALGDPGAQGWLDCHFARPAGIGLTIDDAAYLECLGAIQAASESGGTAPVSQPRWRLGRLRSYIQSVEGGQLNSLIGPDIMARDVASCAASFRFAEPARDTGAVHFTEMTLDEHSVGAEGFVLRGAREPVTWSVALVVPRFSLTGVCLVTPGSEKPAVSVDRASVTNGIGAGWPDDYDIIFADLGLGGPLGADATCLLAVIPIRPSPVKAWVSFLAMPGRLDVNEAPSPEFRQEIWKAAFGLLPPAHRSTVVLQSVFSMDTATLKRADPTGSELTALWKRFPNALPFAVACARNPALLHDVLDRGLRFDVGYEPDTSRDWYPESVGRTPLDIVLLRGRLAAVKDFVQHGYALPPTALSKAVLTKNRDLVSYLLARGLDASASGGAETTPLTGAAMVDDLDTVRLLIAKGADVHTAGGEALYYAAQRRNVEMARLLIEHGADVHYREVSEVFPLPNGRPVLVVAAWPGDGRPGSLEVVKLLVEKGADPEVRDAENHAARDVVPAGSTECKPLAEYLNSLRKP